MLQEYILQDFLFENDIATHARLWDIVSTSGGTKYSKLCFLRFAVSKKIPNEDWVYTYADCGFYKLFRLKKESFFLLLREIMTNYKNIVIKQHFGGYEAVKPEVSLLIFLWYLSKQDTLLSIGDRFRVATSTVFYQTNQLLEIFTEMRSKYICWPASVEECKQVANNFGRYPNVLGAIDGSHIELKVADEDHDSYINRYQTHSINLMAIFDHRKIFTYIFVGFPGSAHDSRVFQNSEFYANIVQHGSQHYFPNNDYHIIGDSAFSCEMWLMTPFKNARTPKQRFHNFKLSADRVCVEHAFGLLKGRWRKLSFLDVYSVEKAVKIVSACVVLHNWCIVNNDVWIEEIPHTKYQVVRLIDTPQGTNKKEQIADFLYRGCNRNI